MNSQVIQMLLEGIRDTLYMTFGSVIIGYVLGLPLGILLFVTNEKGHGSKGAGHRQVCARDDS